VRRRIFLRITIVQMQCKRIRESAREKEREITITMSKRDLNNLQPYNNNGANKDDVEEGKDDSDDDITFNLRT